jgi:ribonuclease HII
MDSALQRHPGYTPRRGGGLTGYERVLTRAGLAPVAGIDEAGRGACAGPLVVAAVALDPRRRSDLAGVADSKALTADAREAAYREVMKHALAWHMVVIPPGDIDALGLHVCNVTGMRRALAGLAIRPGYVLTDGFPVRGLAVPRRVPRSNGLSLPRPGVGPPGPRHAASRPGGPPPAHPGPPQQ